YQSRDEFLKVSVSELYQDPNDRKNFNKKMLSKELVRNEELYLKKKDGTGFTGSVSAVAVKDQNGGVKYYDGIIEDITERKQLESQLQQAHRMEAIGTLAGGIAHDFNNILAAAIGYTEMALNDNANNSALKSNLQEVLKAGHRAKNLVRQILAFSRQADQEVKPLQVKIIVKEALKLLRASLPTTIEIRPNINSDAAVLADPTQIHQVLMNLCTNAQHAMREKGGFLQVSLTSAEIESGIPEQRLGVTAGKYLCLKIRDTGHGMSSAVIDRIFDPFFTTKARDEGTGMGLAVVHGIVNSYKGAVTVESEVGKGSTFKIYLPVIEKEITAPVKTRTHNCNGSENILFVDDETALLDIGQQMLNRLGYHVITKTSSVEALELFQAKPDKFDLVITDMTMPNMTGDKLAQKMLAIRPDIPVILCTGYSHQITEEKAKRIGIKKFIFKPVAIEELARTIRNVMDNAA
ncbi:MAG: response regulator, partial [Deltaproteobacteria bacterium]|nr:response regulator [Deltaproteobacteria bacterium]